MPRILRCCHLQRPLTVHWVIFLRIAGTFFIYFLGGVSCLPFLQSHCLSLYFAEFFCKLPEVFFIYFLGGHLIGDFSNHVASHCTLLNFFANCRNFLKYIFCAGHLVPRGVPVLMTARVLCPAMQTTLSQRAVPATLLCSPVICRM